MSQFKRRYFRNPYEFVASFASMVARLDALPGYLWVSGRVSMAFRQRLWLVVTSPLYLLFYFPGLAASGIVGLWYLYRCIKGWLRFNDNKGPK